MSERAGVLPARRQLADLALGPLAALELLTILRLRRPRLLKDRTFGQTQAWFPAVGLGLGLALVGLAEGLDGYFSGAVLGWILAAALLALTGGLHVDGLSDTADGVFGGRTRAESLAIMRDGRIGALGAAAVVLVLGLKAACLGSLSVDRAEALLLAPTLSRWAMVLAIAAFPYARPEGLGAAFHAAALPWPAVAATATALAATLALLGPRGLVIPALLVVTTLLTGYGISRHLGGLTGDIYGAVNETAEVVALLSFLFLAAEGFLP